MTLKKIVLLLENLIALRGFKLLVRFHHSTHFSFFLCYSSFEQQAKRKLDDVRRRLEILYDLLRANKVRVRRKSMILLVYILTKINLIGLCFFAMHLGWYCIGKWMS